MNISVSRQISTARWGAWATLLIVAAAAACGMLTLCRGDCDDNLNDLSVSVEKILSWNSDVANVEVLVAPPQPTHRIIHIVDSHDLPRDRFTKAVGTVFGDGRFSDRQVHEWYQMYASQVEQFQTVQKRVLLWLADRHGLREVFHEGASADDLPEVRRRVAFFRKVAPGRDRWRRELARLSQEIREREADGLDATAIREQQRLYEDIRDYELNFGAIGALLVDRPFVQVRAAEDAKAFANFKRVKVGRAMRSPHGRARDAAIVHNLLSGGTCAVILLGSAHDLSQEVEKQGGGRCEYIRVTTADFPPPLEEMLAPGGVISQFR